MPLFSATLKFKIRVGGKCNLLNYWRLVNLRSVLFSLFHRIIHRRELGDWRCSWNSGAETHANLRVAGCRAIASGGRSSVWRSVTLAVSLRLRATHSSRVHLPPENWFTRPGSRAFFNSRA